MGTSMINNTSRQQFIIESTDRIYPYIKQISYSDYKNYSSETLYFNLSILSHNEWVKVVKFINTNMVIMDYPHKLTTYTRRKRLWLKMRPIFIHYIQQHFKRYKNHTRDELNNLFETI